jgi:hypothetical protein
MTKKNLNGLGKVGIALFYASLFQILGTTTTTASAVDSADAAT